MTSLARTLAHLPDALHDLDVTITRTGSRPHREKVNPGHRAHPLPLNITASNARVRLTRTLRVASRHCTTPDDGPRNASPTACAAHLLRALHAGNPHVHDFEDAIMQAHEMALDAIDHTPRTIRIHAGPRLCTSAEAARLTESGPHPVKAATIRQWAARGQIQRHRIDGTTYYRLDEVQAAAA